MIFVKDTEKTAKETSAEFWRKIEGNTLQNDLTSLIELKQHYIEEHSNPQDAMVALHKKSSRYFLLQKIFVPLEVIPGAGSLRYSTATMAVT